MTPLAAYLTKQIAARPKDRAEPWCEPKNIEHLREVLDDIHCFEITQALPVMLDLGSRFCRESMEKNEALFETYAFLPAPKTWVEWRHATGNRIGVALIEIPKASMPQAAAVMFTHEVPVNLGGIMLHGSDYHDTGGERYWPNWLVQSTREMGITDAAMSDKIAAGVLSFVHTALVLINSPKIIGRQQHMPHRGLERQLTKGLGAGKFPLHAWTEILLEVNKPPEIDDGESHEAHLTGRRALHFCRKHIRIRLGHLEYVSAHWRGDPALGIKRSRYSVKPSTQREVGQQ